MLDLKSIRENPEDFDSALTKRGMSPVSAEIIRLDAGRREILQEIQELQQKRNEVARQIGALKKSGEDAGDALREAERIKQKIAEIEQSQQEDDALDRLLLELPNLPAEDVPVGKDESGNVELRRVGHIPRFDFDIKDHVALGERLGMDFEAAAKLSGSRFVVLKGALSRLERALAQFMLDLHTREFGYEEVSVPLLVRDPALTGTGQLPKFEEDLFRTTSGHHLIPTAEVPLTNLVRESILDAGQLPLRFTAYTPCFRSEAGAAGKDTRGMIRLHQFGKIELVSITEPDQSDEEHQRMLSAAERVLQQLQLPYRVVTLCTGDMGFSARKTYDLEVWLPAQDTYREISSISNCGDFQARRMKARYRRQGEKQTRFVHTLNGSALAVGRTLVAILENYQNADGSVRVPDVLQPILGMDTLFPDEV